MASVQRRAADASAAWHVLAHKQAPYWLSKFRVTIVIKIMIYKLHSTEQSVSLFAQSRERGVGRGRVQLLFTLWKSELQMTSAEHCGLVACACYMKGHLELRQTHREGDKHAEEVSWVCPIMDVLHSLCSSHFPDSCSWSSKCQWGVNCCYVVSQALKAYQYVVCVYVCVCVYGVDTTKKNKTKHCIYSLVHLKLLSSPLLWTLCLSHHQQMARSPSDPVLH